MLSSDLITPADLVSEMLTRSRQLDEAQQELVARTHAWAGAENAYRKARATAYLAAEGPIETRKITADQATVALHLSALLEEGLKVAALEAVRSRRAQLSAAQSIANAVKAEVELASFGEGA